MRLHPAESRISKLAAETPALLIVFDLPAARRTADLDRATAQSSGARRSRTVHRVSRERASLRLSPATTRRRRGVDAGWHAPAAARSTASSPSGSTSPIAPGERAMLKIKRLRTADCVVGGFRYATGSQAGRLAAARPLRRRGPARSCRLHLGDLRRRAAGADAQARRLARRARLHRRCARRSEPLVHRAQRRNGSRCEPKLVVEVQYDHVTGDRFRHGTRFVRWRPDKPPRQCTFDQLQREGAAVAADARDAAIGTGGSPPARPARRPPSPRCPARSRRARVPATAAPWQRRSRRTDR